MDAICLIDPENEKRILKIGQYTEGSYGIAASTDGGLNWEAAVDFDGVSGGGDSGGTTTVVQGETIVKSETAPTSPAVDALWVDKASRRLKLWDGTEWVVIGYEPEETGPTEPPVPEEPTDPETPETGEGTETSPETEDTEGGGV